MKLQGKMFLTSTPVPKGRAGGRRSNIAQNEKDTTNRSNRYGQTHAVTILLVRTI